MSQHGTLTSEQALREALRDMLEGWKYIRRTHGDMYGVGWDRAQQKAEAALSATQPAQAAQGDPAEIMQMVDTLIANMNEAHHANSKGWRDACFQSADRVREKIKDAVTGLTEQQGAGEVVTVISKFGDLCTFSSSSVRKGDKLYTQPAAGADVLDAKRYRWLRAQDNEDFAFAVVKNPHFDVYGAPEELDAAIDAAIAASGRQS